MLKSLHLREVGPAPTFDAELGERLNIFTGDNGLGKTFLLDVAWWALTKTWVGEQAMPRTEGAAGRAPMITYDIVRDTPGKHPPFEATFHFPSQGWLPAPGPPVGAGLVIYARVDGGFSVWDPARNKGRGEPDLETASPDRPAAFHFTPKELWWGLPSNGNGKVICNGLIRDWVNWQNRSRARKAAEKFPFAALERVIKHLSPDEDELIELGDPMRVSLENAIDIPTIRLPYGTIPITVASAGIRRITGLAYLLVWAWHEHCLAAELRHERPRSRVLLLMDEVESHLHPKWQRRVLPSVLTVAEALRAALTVQVIATTHAPLVLASVETLFDKNRDRLFSFELPSGSEEVVLSELPWTKQGDAVNWLVSDAFGLRQARSKEAEEAIEAAQAFMRGDKRKLPKGLRTKEAIDHALRQRLSELDPFWPRWSVEAQT